MPQQGWLRNKPAHWTNKYSHGPNWRCSYQDGVGSQVFHLANASRVHWQDHQWIRAAISPVSRFGLAVRRNLLRLSFLFKSYGLWILSCDFVPHNYETLKRLSSLPTLLQKSFWWWQCSDRYIISLSPLPPYGGGGDSSVARAPDSWLKGRGFESLLERRENFLLQGRLSVLTLISVSVPPPCYRSST